MDVPIWVALVLLTLLLILTLGQLPLVRHFCRRLSLEGRHQKYDHSPSITHVKGLGNCAKIVG